MQSLDKRSIEHDRNYVDLSHDAKVPNSTALLFGTGDTQNENDFEQVDYSREWKHLEARSRLAPNVKKCYLIMKVADRPSFTRVSEFQAREVIRSQ